MLETDCKSIVQKFVHKGYDWFGLDYNMNLYRGCCHRCIYCDSRSSCYGIIDFDTVRIKKNCIDILSRELKGKRSKGVVGTGAMSDPYNPFEKEHKFTRQSLEWIDHFHFGISMVTKSSLIVRDIDILSRIDSHSPVITKLTVTAADDRLASLIEPAVCPSSERFAAVKELSSAGIFAGVMLMPVLPFITDTEENIAGIINAAHESGASFIYPSFGVTLRDNQRDYFYNQLDKSFHGLKARYMKTFGDSYVCNSPSKDNLRKFFENECSKRGLLYKMSDIIAAYKSEK